MLTGKIATIGWALYLACSWTWCIGMFLPVLMVRDFGFAGWVVFAIPNMVGAAALGWVLSRPGLAQQIATQHSIACQSFSSITFAFQCFFLAWVVRGLIGWAGVAIGLAIMLAMWLLMRGGRSERILATIVFAISTAAICVCIGREGVLPHVLPAGIRQPLNLLSLSPVVCFGFLLCPYLDLTFHRARAMTSTNSGIAAFTLGFGLFFPLMIAFSLWYAPLLKSEQFADVPRILALIFAIHMLVQVAFTMALHLRPLAAKDASISIRWTTLALSLVAIAIPLAAERGTSAIVASVRNEQVYRIFMAFYGLVFPAYVWICMIPMRGVPVRKRHLALLLAILVAAPMMWLGFIAGKMIWLVPGLATVLAARFVLLAITKRASAQALPSRPRVANH